MATLTMSATTTPAAAGVGGRFEFDDGGSYAGDWTDGMAHGHGVCTGPGGQGEFAGAWQLGFETSGVYRAAPTTTAAVYEGQWLQGRRHGLGVDSRGLPWATEAASPGGGPRWLYRGEWTQGFRGRYGVRQSTATGTKYEGTWTGGLQDGYGVETYADGGTYQGQWLRGVRHGYGIRQSVSYDLAARYPIHQAFPIPGLPIGGPPSPPEKEDDAMLRDRDLRIEESRGGFVLLARTTPLENDPHKHRMVLDKYGKPSIRKTIVKMMRQRSAGDVRESAPPSRSSSRMSGSVRSTSSQSSYASSTTGAGSVYSDEGSEASFVSQADLPPETFGQTHEIIERYLGEWKGDRRSGYGVAERTDGLRYEGEWASNRKHGYGATILRDGTRIEGKYKNNILVASSSGGKGSSKLFPLRSGKLRDRVDAAVKAAQHAAEVAKQKAEIASARMLSARMKAEQVEEVAKKAVVDAEMARAKAREYSPGIGQPGSNIIANRPTQETDIGADFSYVDGFDGQLGGSPPIQAQTSPTRLLSFFKSKKSPSTAPSVHSDISSASYAGGGGGLGGSSVVVGGGGTLRNNRLNRSDAQLQQQQQAGGYTLQTPSTSASVSTGWTATPNGRGAGRQNGSTPGGWPPSSSASSSVSASPSRPAGLFGGVDVQFDGMNRNQQQQQQQQQLQQQQFMQQQQPQFQQQQLIQQQQQQQLYATQPVAGSGASPPTEFYSTAGLSSAESQLAGSRFNIEGPQVQAAWFQHPDSMQAAGAARWDAAGGQAFTAGLRPGDVTRSLYAHGDSGGVAGGPAGGGPTVDGWTSAEPSRSGTLRQAGLQRSFDDDMTPAAARYLASGERRKSLPSIVKQRTVVVEPAPGSTAAAAAAAAARGPPGSRTTTETTGGVRPGDAVVKRAQVDLFVIENGVKRKVKPTETVDKGRAVPGERAVSKASGGPAASPTAAVRRRFFTLEATRRAEKGSVPDVSAISNDEVLPREVVAMMSQRRREELIRQRAEAERRQGNQIVVCLGDLKDWCERRRVVVLLIAINISLASVFYSLLAQ